MSAKSARNRATEMVESYRQVLARVGHLLAFGVPDSLLPCPRDEIRQALRDFVRLCVDDSLQAGAELDDLRSAYQSLASFLPYEEANAAARLHHAFERGDYAFLASPAAEAAMQLSRRIEHEAARLAREFGTLLAEPADPVLSEVNAFLDEFGRKLTTPFD